MIFQSKADFNMYVDKKIKQLSDYGKGLNDKIDFQWVSDILEQSKKYLANQSSVLQLCGPIKVVGSIHGHFKDLINIFETAGSPSDVSYIFLGNYINYGTQSLQTILLLILYKIKSPSTFFLLRGCNENSIMSKLYGFQQQCKVKCNQQIWQKFYNFFYLLPYAAIINHKILCISGGIGPDFQTLKQIQHLSKNSECMGTNISSDIVWSEPNKFGLGFSKNIEGYGVMYGRDTVQIFMARNNLQVIFRSRNLINQGFQLIFDKKIISIFSAPNFIGKFNNSASIISIFNNLECQIQVYKPKIIQTSASDMIF